MSVTDQTSGVSYATLSLAITGSASGDVLEVPAGAYVENFPTITHSLTIESVGGLATLTNPQAQPPNDKGVLDVALDSGASLTVQGLEISGAVADASSNNGAGIRFEGGNGTLTVNNCYIHNNQDGILTGATDQASPNGQMSVVIENSEIAYNGVDSSNPEFGYDHNIYVGAVTELTVTNSYLHDAEGGNEVKSRALTTVITDNRIQDGSIAPSNYEIDIPDAGVATVTGNTIEKGANAQNRSMIHYGGEGTYATSSLLVDSNTFINDRANGATGLYNQTSLNGANVPATVSNNTLYNVGAANLNQDANAPPPDVTSNNDFISGAAPPLDTSPGYTVACFAHGTRIETARGAVRVQDLQLGDLAMLAAGGSRPIMWIGRRHMRCDRHARPETIWPIRVTSDAFGPGRPCVDLDMSPEHAVFAAGVLVPVGELIDGHSIFQIETDAITYWHVELDSHDVILAEGLAVESYLENANREDFDGEALASHPIFAGMATPCAPIIRQGPVLEQVRGLVRQTACV